MTTTHGTTDLDFDLSILRAIRPLDFSGGYAFRTLSSLRIRVQPASDRRSAA